MGEEKSVAATGYSCFSCHHQSLPAEDSVQEYVISAEFPSQSAKTLREGESEDSAWTRFENKPSSYPLPRGTRFVIKKFKADPPYA